LPRKFVPASFFSPPSTESRRIIWFNQKQELKGIQRKYVTGRSLLPEQSRLIAGILPVEVTGKEKHSQQARKRRQKGWQTGTDVI
jgi:hypothetical protein